MVFLYPGAIHIHSIHSDGTGTIQEIAQSAKKAGLNWIIITDHNNMDGVEGIYDGVCVIIGEEISPPTESHYLAFNIKTPINPNTSANEYIKKVKEQGGFGFIAHPDASELRKNTYKPLRWANWDIKDFGGIEIWNYMSDWGDYYDDINPLKALHSYLFRNNVLAGPTKNVLAWWDNLNNETSEIIPAIGGIDAHALNIKKFFVPVTIFPYQNILGTITNFIHLDNVLPDEFEGRKLAILNAIKSAKNLIVNRVWSRKCSNPSFYIQNRYQKAYAGAVIEFDSCSKMIVELPLKADIKIIYNGKVIIQKKTKSLEFNKLDKGKYRMEAYYKNRPWIFSNPILVK